MGSRDEYGCEQQWTAGAPRPDTKNSQSQQQRTTAQGRRPNGGPGQARGTAKGRSGKQRTPNGPEVSDGSLRQKETVNATQSSHASPLVWGLGDWDVSDEDSKKQPIIPCAGSLGHELQFLQRSPYNQCDAYDCNMCYKFGSKDLYHCEICQFDSHKACAEIQEEVKVIFHKHPLQRDHMDDEEFTCSFCGGDEEADIRPWVYKCLICPNFIVHARCAKYPESLKHRSHPHKLKLVQKQVICDGCRKCKRQGYHYRCERCDFDLHPLCAILPSAPLCRLNRTHRVEIDYMASETCHLCNSQHDKTCWMYRCTVCNVCMHTDCFSLEHSDSGDRPNGGPGQARGTAKGRSGKQRTPNGPEVSDGSLRQKETVNATQSSHASPLVWGLGDWDVSDEDSKKQPIIPCAGSLGHELQFLQRSPYNQCDAYDCNMCYKFGSKDLYHCEICQFDSHKACAEIQEEVKVIFHKHPLQRDHMDDEEFTCSFCGGDEEADIRPWVYKCLICPNFIVHARCAKYPESLKHRSHPHKLKLVQKQVICDGCRKCKRQGYHYRCERCDFDLHPLCAILPSAPLCRLNRTHRVEIDYMASETCHLCNSQHDKTCWMYRCTVCNVCIHIDCFSLERSDSVEELSDSDEEFSDSDEVDEDFSALYQKFFETMEDFDGQRNEEHVEQLSELVDSFKSNTKARSSVARQLSVKSSLYPKISTPAQRELHILNDGFAKMSLGDSSRSEVRNREAEEEERRRAEQAAKEQKAERRREKAATRALQEKENIAWREDIASQMQNLANKLLNIPCNESSGSSNVATATQVAELQASIENWKTSDAKRHQEQSKLLQERHFEYMSGLHEIIRTQVHSKTRAVPRLVLCSETMSYSRKLLTVLRVGLKGVRLDLLCEHAEQPHVVSGAPGCEINQKVAGDRWTNLQPFLAAGVQIVTLAVNFAGMGALNNVLPNFHQKVWDIRAVDLGEHAMPTGRNKLIPKLEPVAEESAADWLKFYLRDQNINIAETFKLHRVRYKSPDHVKGTVGWLCEYHRAEGMKDLVLDPFP